ncbi:MAG TPA: hypothetical protein VF170_02240, partial [Planctomycetaceae bacterium]
MNVLRTRRRGRPAAPARRGSVLVVVLALLAALMLLGFLFYTVASQERENARYFTASEKWYSAQLDPDTLFDFALEQVIVGPQDDYANSALWGGRYSLLASLVGDDLQPYSGAGVNVVDAGQLVGTPDGVPTVDQDQNGVADPPAGGDSNGDSVDDVDADGDGIHDNLSLNLAWIAATTGLTDLRFQFAKPDVGYSYADLNSPFLAYVGREPMTGATVVIPSFHRPQYLRGLFNNPPSSPTVPPDQWYTDPRTGPLVLRPHAAKNVLEFDYSTGTIVDTGVPRYTDAELIRRTTAPAF